jgi:uncharacterized protein YegJ (DUF2314 family)
MANEDDLVPVFIPALSAILLHAEDLKGEPLTSEEVIRVRNAATCIMMKREDARKLAESRGYEDVDPKNCWYAFQMLRREIGRQPDLDPGPLFREIDGEDPAYLRTIDEAQRTLSQFRAMLPADGSPRQNALLKTLIVQEDQSAYMWLSHARRKGNSFVATFFEVPNDLHNYEVGNELEIAARDVVDWMVNEDGILQGGYSVRYQRERMPEEARAEYDEYIGVTKYA